MDNNTKIKLISMIVDDYYVSSDPCKESLETLVGCISTILYFKTEEDE